VEKIGLVSAKLKLARATKHLKAIKRCIATYAASRPYKFTNAKGHKTGTLTITREPPPEISILAGEMVYQMRSALDHLAFDLVKRNSTGVALPPTWFKRCEFPLYITVPIRIKAKKGNPSVPHTTPVPYSVFTNTLPGISKQAFTFIEGVQPYYRRASINSALNFLAELSNIDKHRHLNVVYARVRESHTVRFASGLRSRGHQALDRGAKLPTETGWNKSDRPVYVNRRLQAFVAFKESALGGASTFAVEYLLELILKELQTLIIPAFEKLI
jgi:hypothetical protein